jgi:hypothetical protein
MSLLVIAHATIIVCYLFATFFLWRGWKDNQLEKKFNVALRNSAIALVDDMQEQIDKNEKLVAKAKEQVAAAMAAVTADTTIGEQWADDPKDAMQDPVLLGSLLTAIVIKYGDVRLGIEDMALTEGKDSVSVYVDTRTKEMVLSTKHDLEGNVSFYSLGGTDDETYH